MKKLILALGVAFLSAVGVQAQVGYGIKAGVNLGKYSNVQENVEDHIKMNPSFYLTGYADLFVATNVSVQPGISLQGKGDKFSYVEEGYSEIETRNVISVEIPVNVVYYIPVADVGSVFLGGGPYAGYAISGRYKWTLQTDEDSDSLDEKIKFSGADKSMKPFDAGINFLAGFKLANGFLVNAGYNLGLTNLSPNDAADFKFSNRVLSFGIGFQF